MNRNQRNYGRPAKIEEIDFRTRRNRPSTHDIEEVLPPRSRRNSFKTDKFMTNRCCHISPVQKNAEQLTDINDQFSELIKQQSDSDNIIPDTIKQDFKNEFFTTTAKVDNSSQYQNQTSTPYVKTFVREQWQNVENIIKRELKSEFCNKITKVDNSSQYPKQISTPSYVETFDGSHWQNVENTFELEQFLNAEKEDLFTSNQYSGKRIRISEVPHVKVIAEKFSKFKKNNVEVRRLEEKIVCLEYDVFTSDIHCVKPVQTMKAYFSVKPTMNSNDFIELPTSIKNKFNISDEDLGKLNEKEIEIINSKIAENKPYLDDLKKILKRRQAIYSRKKKTTLDLMSLYEMAKRETPIFDDFSNTNLLSKAELDEIKELITKQCASSIHGISRRTVKNYDKKNDNINVISQSIFTELIRNV